MVKLKLELSKLEIEILSYCICTAIDVKPMNEQQKQKAKKILTQLSKYLDE
jgi:hypothetical protein